MVATEQDVETLVDFLKVLADRNRLRILGMLGDKERTVKEIAEALGVKEPTVSWHLHALKGRGLVAMREQGTAHYYTLQQDGVHSLLKELTKRASEQAEI